MRKDFRRKSAHAYEVWVTSTLGFIGKTGTPLSAQIRRTQHSYKLGCCGGV